MFPISPGYEVEYEPAEDDPEIYPAPPIVTNRDPLRFYYNGMAQPDDIAACI
jgi:hypothetical protein